MSIHVRAMHAHQDTNCGPEPDTLFMTLTGESIRELQRILNRSLNCDPGENKDWFQLADRLHIFLTAPPSP